MYYIVFDIGGTSIKYSIMNKDGEFIESDSVKTPLQGENKTQEVLVDVINAYKIKYDIKGVAMSVPGGIDDDGYIHFMGQVKDLQCMYLNKYIKEHTGLNCIYDNDVNCVAMAEKYKGNAVDNKNFVCITIGTGIGGGIFINNQLYRGYRGMAGEFGINILEHRLSRLEDISMKTFSRLGSTYNLIDRVNKLKNSNLDGIQVFELAKEDKDVQELIEDFYFSLAVGVYNIVYNFAPEKILLGGGVSSREDLIENINRYLNLLNPEILDMVTISTCKFQNDSGKIGALYKYLNTNF
ncbi:MULTISPECIES: ROK family protein [Romboutsia]|jgi:beta-glucoside kinase|uniref:ROK family protein n=1 Tax=Romboutsia TaxID=1501226 RepID=UPI00216F691D|nr:MULTISPECIES: ROK family protein [Romboutsia]MCI9061231.1 ROK family protein [Romboutsia sp.]MCI9259470.1 ROK family protein [Romboutsia sp.]